MLQSQPWLPMVHAHVQATSKQPKPTAKPAAARQRCGKVVPASQATTELNPATQPAYVIPTQQSQVEPAPPPEVIPTQLYATRTTRQQKPQTAPEAEEADEDTESEALQEDGHQESPQPVGAPVIPPTQPSAEHVQGILGPGVQTRPQPPPPAVHIKTRIAENPLAALNPAVMEAAGAQRLKVPLSAKEALKQVAARCASVATDT